jgi:hyperosmotically inducible protein
MRTLTIIVAVMSLTVLSGCTPAEKAEVRQDARELGQQVEAAAENAQQEVENAALEAKVKTALSTRKGLDADEINVEARGAAVTLKGDVASREQAELAEQAARQTEGVSTVDNQLMLRVPAKGSGASVPGPPPARAPR